MSVFYFCFPSCLKSRIAKINWDGFKQLCRGWNITKFPWTDNWMDLTKPADQQHMNFPRSKAGRQICEANQYISPLMGRSFAVQLGDVCEGDLWPCLASQSFYLNITNNGLVFISLICFLTDQTNLWLSCLDINVLAVDCIHSSYHCKLDASLYWRRTFLFQTF